MSCACEKTQVGGRALVVRADPDCRWHGLPAGYSGHPPLRRHARDGEDDRTAERRLYAEAMTGIAWAPPQTSRNSLRGRVYWERGQPVRILAQWGTKKQGEATHGGPRNVLIRRLDGSRVVRPFRGLRKSPPPPTPLRP